MCTYSLIRVNDARIITMNRDESRTRHEGEFQELLSSERRRVFPTDSLAGGTWFGANDNGLVLALLNRYQASNPSAYKSRGLLIPLFLETWQSAAQISELTAEQCRDYNPFDLIASDPQQTWRLSWDGQQVRCHHHIEQSFTFSSSALNTQHVLDYRQGLFSIWQSNQEQTPAVKDVAISILRDFHLYQKDDAQTQSVLMDRNEAHTKSICQFTALSSETHLHYFPESTLASLRAQQRLKENPYQHGLVYRVNG